MEFAEDVNIFIYVNSELKRGDEADKNTTALILWTCV